MTHGPKRSVKRPRPPAPTTWPAFVLAILVAIGVAGGYALRAPSLPLDARIKPILWPLVNHALVPTVVIALAVWCLLYYGFVRWKNGERGPLHFNTLLGVVLATLLLAPLARHQLERQQAGDFQGLQADTARFAATQRVAEARASAPLDTALKAAAVALELNPRGLASVSQRKQAKAQLATARQASNAYHAGYAARAADDRAAYQQVVAGRAVAPRVAQASLATYDRLAQGRLLRAAVDFKNEQALLDEADGGVRALDHGLAAVNGYDVWFSSQADAQTFDQHRRNAVAYRNRLARVVGGADLAIASR